MAVFLIGPVGLLWMRLVLPRVRLESVGGAKRAVNLDAGCGWAQGKADVLYVADAFEVMKEVNALLS